MQKSPQNLIEKILTVSFVLVGLGVLAVAVNYTFFGPDIPLVLRVIFFSLLFTDAICYFVAAWGVWKNIKWLYPLIIALLAINIIGIIFDDIGFVDIAAAVYNVILLVLLIHNHNKWKNSTKN